MVFETDVMALTMTRQLAMPGAMVSPETETMLGKVAVAMPAQPEIEMVEPALSVRPAGRVSIKPMPA